MKHEIEVQFEVGDTVWHKDLITNEAKKTKIRGYQAIVQGGENGENKCVLYHTEDCCPIVNIEGKPSNTDLFATKEECDSFPPFDPATLDRGTPAENKELREDIEWIIHNTSDTIERRRIIGRLESMF